PPTGLGYLVARLGVLARPYRGLPPRTALWGSGTMQSMDAVVEIDALVEAALTDPSRLTSVWRATFALPRWWFLHQGAAASSSLYVGTISGEPYLTAFTTAQRLREFAIGNGLCPAEVEVPAASMTPLGFLSVAEQFHANGVTGIAFDHNINGYYAPLCNLPGLWESTMGSAPDLTSAAAPAPRD
ncbi:MAG: hypothetical protein ACRDQ1_19725, partial [Sciscionella sp.]